MAYKQGGHGVKVGESHRAKNFMKLSDKDSLAKKMQLVNCLTTLQEYWLFYLDS